MFGESVGACKDFSMSTDAASREWHGHWGGLGTLTKQWGKDESHVWNGHEYVLWAAI